MSTLPAAGRFAVVPSRRTPFFWLKATAFALMVALAVAFVGKYVFHYYLHYNEAAFTDPLLGAPNYWSLRGWLLLHITGGMVALLTGPFQFWTGFRARHFRLHRWTGRLFLAGVAAGSIGSVYMATHTSYGWAFGFALLMLALAWISTTGMAYYAILKRRIQVHKEWMVRAYVVTFAFVTFRILNDYGPTSHLQPENDKSITVAWTCWAVPLLITEVVLQLRRMKSPSPLA